MQATQFATLAAQVRKLPAERVGRDRRLLRFTDHYASTEAAAALQAAARNCEDGGVLANVLNAARAVVVGGLEDNVLRDDTAAHDRLSDVVMRPEFLALLPAWVAELRAVASSRPETGACTVATALELWSWTAERFRAGKGVPAEAASQALDELAGILSPLIAARSLALEIANNEPSGTPAEIELRLDLCHVQAARAAATSATACAELVFGYRRHLVWDAEGCSTCYAGDAVDDLEAVMPGIASGARSTGSVVESDGSHAVKAGPCASFEGLETFTRLRRKLDGCLTGARFARDRAAAAIARSMAAMTSPEGRA